MSTTIPTYRYQYRQPSSSSHPSSFSLSPPRNTLPHHYLESPTNIFLSPSNPLSELPEIIIIRQVGGPGDNHVQWVSKSDIIPFPDPDDESSNGGGRRKQHMKTYVSQVHGIVHTANWANDVGDRLWLRSDQPIIKGRRSVPVVNLDKGVSGEVCINSVNWLVDKREISTGATITIIGAEYRHVQGQRRGGGGGPFRMCVTQEGNGEGIIEIISLEELETCFEDVKPPPSVHDHSHYHVPPPTELQILGDSNHISRQLRGAATIFGETNSRIMDDDGDDDNLSQVSFASSTKGKVAIDLVARSLSIFNFNAAMLDLAALSNQSMGGFIRDIDEQPEASDDSDEEDGDEEEERVWSDCESHCSRRQSAMDDEGEDERSRAEDSASRSGADVRSL
ncbi:hypothetical protein B0H65DRAFT_504811 [Neurospora tetraspora]|uniref:Uncharacterized protein n=1 Tax=Neurospora tetraspora TaxID=94610 RepID=A0AAE0JNC1_9PEZI|nr:hypothetical protein B0H65DRAFT_504811 [Neurospora tetraspora]